MTGLEPILFYILTQAGNFGIKKFFDKLYSFADQYLNDAQSIDEAFHKIIALAYYETYIRAFNYSLGNSILSKGCPEITDLESFNINESLISVYQIDDFNETNFWNQKIIQTLTDFYFSHIPNLLTTLNDQSSDEEKRITTNKIKTYIKINLKANYKILLKNKRYQKEEYKFFKGCIDVLQNKTPEQQISLLSSEKAEEYTEPILSDTNLPLHRLYVSPAFGYLNLENLKKNKSYYHLAYSAKDEDFIFKNENIHELLNRFLANEMTEHEITKMGYEEHPNVSIILGYPGQGKTSLCKRLLYDIDNHLIDNLDDRNIIFLSLKDMHDLKANLVNGEKLLGYIYSLFCKKISILPSYDEQRNCIIILDGLDELQMLHTADNNNSLVTNLFEKLWEITSQTNKKIKTKFIVTSRHNLIQLKKNHWEDFLVLCLAPFDLLRQKLWVKNYKEIYPETIIDEQELDKVNENELFNHIKELIEQPLLLYFLAQVNNPVFYDKFVGVGLTEFKNRTQFYDSFFDSLGKREKKKGIASISHSFDVLLSYLRKLAFNIFIGEKYHLTFAEIKKILGTELSDNELQLLCLAFYFKGRNAEQNDQKAIEFYHNSFWEYQAACYIVQSLEDHILDKDNEQILKYIWEHFRHRTFSSSRTEYVQKYIEELLSSTREKFCRDNNKDMNRYIVLKKRDRIVDTLIKFYSFGESKNFMDLTSPLTITQYEYPIAMSDFVKSNLTKLIRLLDPDKRTKELKHGRHHFYFFTNHVLVAKGVSLRDLELYFCDLEKMILDQADLKGVDLRRANLRNTSLRGANLIEADLSKAYLLNADLTAAKLIDSILHDTKLNNSILKNTVLSKSKLISANLSSANLTNAILKESILQKTILNETTLTNANFNKATLTSCKLINCKSHNVNLSESILNNIVFSGVNLNNSNFKFANLDSVRFINSDLTSVDFRNTKFKNVTFENSHLDSYIINNKTEGVNIL